MSNCDVDHSYQPEVTGNRPPPPATPATELSWWAHTVVTIRLWTTMQNKGNISNMSNPSKQSLQYWIIFFRLAAHNTQIPQSTTKKAALLLTSHLLFISQSGSIFLWFSHGFDVMISIIHCTSARSSAFLAFNEAAFCPVSTKSRRASEMLAKSGTSSPKNPHPLQLCQNNYIENHHRKSEFSH